MTLIILLFNLETLFYQETKGIRTLNLCCPCALLRLQGRRAGWEPERSAPQLPLETLLCWVWNGSSNLAAGLPRG